MASPELQTTTSAVSSHCQCGRCGEVITACHLENRPASRDPQHHTVLCGWYLEQTSIALYGSKDGEERESRRKSEESLYKFWEIVDIDLEASPFRVLPRWALNDHLLRKIRGLPPDNETYEQSMVRLREEMKDHPFCGDGPYPSIPSPSTFTSYGSEVPDGDLSNSPESLLEDGKSGTVKPNNEIVKASGSNSVASVDFQDYFRESSAHTEERLRSRETTQRDHYKMPIHSNDHNPSPVTNHELYNADRYTSDSSSKSYSEFSSPLTPLPSSQLVDMAEVENPSLPARYAQIEDFSPKFQWYDHGRLLRQNAISQTTKVTFFELDHSGKRVIPRPLSNTRELHRRVESDRDIFCGEGGNRTSTARRSAMPLEQANRRIHTTLKRKRDTGHALPSESDSASINPALAPRLRPRERLCYKT